MVDIHASEQSLPQDRTEQSDIFLKTTSRTIKANWFEELKEKKHEQFILSTKVTPTETLLKSNDNEIYNPIKRTNAEKIKFKL